MKTIPTGVRELDSVRIPCTLGFPCGRHSYVAGKPGTGKSTFLECTARAALNNGLRVYWATWAEWSSKQPIQSELTRVIEPEVGDLQAAFEGCFDLYLLDGFQLMPNAMKVNKPSKKTIVFAWRIRVNCEPGDMAQPSLIEQWGSTVGQVIYLERNPRDRFKAYVFRPGEVLFRGVVTGLNRT